MPSRSLRTAASVAHEVVLVALFVLAYFGVRGATEASTVRAFANADALARLEDRAGIAWEATVQAPVLAHDWLLTLANWVYVFGHWPVIAAAAVVLYRCRRQQYLLLRNAIFVSAALGFLFFALVPVAPPRFADPALVDTVTEHSNAYRALQPPSLTNKYAALPSLHAGWNLLVGIVLFGAARSRVLRAFAIAMPVAMAWAVVATANHFVLDVALGVVVVLIGLGVARWVGARTLVTHASRAPIPAGELALRHRPPLGQLAGRAPRRGADRHGGGRGGRSPLSRPARGSASEDDRARPDPVGPLGAR